MKIKALSLLPWCVPAALCLVLLGSNVAQAFTSTQATNAWNNFNNAFYVGNNGNAYYNWTQGGSMNTTAFWSNAEMIEMAVDRAQRSGSSGDKAIVTALVNGFDATYGSDWTGNTFNDDIMWACLAHLRAYFVTGSTNTNWATEAANNFNWVYNGGHSPGRTAAQVDGTYGGGMWWTTDHSSTGTKNACVNGPAALVGYYLSTIWPSGTGFLSQAHALYNWEKATLVNSSGNVADHTGSGGVTGVDLSYNAGTFIGAAYLLGDSAEANLAAAYFMNNCCGANGIIPAYGSAGNNNDGFNGIFFRWMVLYMNGAGTQGQFAPWLYANASAALAVMNSAGLSWNNWASTTPSSGLYSWDCSDTVVALNALPPSASLSGGVHQLAPGCAPGLRLDDNAAGTTNGNKVQIWQYNGSVAQQWNFAAVGTNTWNMAVNIGPYCLDGGAAQVGTPTQIWSCNGTVDQSWVSGSAAQSGAWNFASKQSGLCLDVNGAGTTNGTVVQSYTCNGTLAQAWFVQ